MNEIQVWLDQVKVWYFATSTNGVSGIRDDTILVEAINNTPTGMFVSVDSHLHSEAIAYWLDACLQLSNTYQHQGKIDLAFSYLQFAYSKVQEMATTQDQDPDMKRWCLKKLDTMIVGLMEFCQRQHEDKWHQQSIELVNFHVLFMEGQYHQNLAYPSNNGIGF
ncbi:hypothetical protein C9I98_08530 [Photobacterium sanctipauli]|uniref:Transcriptional regulator n=1 Tax=Photobacterium sanctipauli TaxID=1342794 RepID=A0A2T3NUX0_9GAMM|nr:hypothetical protein [Photobacterium sanctipauli]PSW20096.1 hypothetical protein C9I98_08530 [Photobacterium sanctipauli]